MQHADDAQLMRLIAQGERPAFELLLERHIDPLYNYALRLCGSHAQAEDLVQETWLTVWEKAHTYRSRKAGVATWLHRIVHHRFIDLTRRRSRRNEVSTTQLDVADQATMSTPATVEPVSDAGDEAAALYAALDSLPVEQRAAVMLRHAQGFANPQIARIMNTSTRAVESLLARGKRALRASLNAPQTHTDPGHKSNA
ncbi:MAG: sigma-70 family RNA polymerase sigma factor [Pseudomonadota bacterium]